MLITAHQAGNWVRIVREDGLRIFEEVIPTNEAMDLMHALLALFQLRDGSELPPPHELETVSDIERA